MFQRIGQVFGGKSQDNHFGHEQYGNTGEVRPQDIIILTSEGRTALFERQSGGMNLKLCMELEAAGGTMSALRLSQKCRISFDEMKDRVPDLQSAGYIRCRGTNEAIS